MKDEVKMQESAWCFDIRTGWAEIEDAVWSSDTSDAETARSRAGYATSLISFGQGSFSLEFQIYRNDTRTGPQYYVEFSAEDNVEHFYLANLPSLLAWLKDAAPVFQAGLLGDLISPDFGDSILDNIRSYVAGAAQARRRKR
jgi:hypothetical protein